MSVAAGELDQQVEVTENNEIGRLAEAFNHMLSMRHMHEQALEQSHNETQTTLSKLKDQAIILQEAKEDAEAAVEAKGEFAEAMALRAQEKGLEMILDVTQIGTLQ